MIERELIEECRNGNLSNFRKLVEKTSPFAFSVAFRITGDEEEARDIVQETMITIWQKLKRIKSSESYRTWVYRITMNKCFDFMRKAKREPEFRPDDHTWDLISNTISDGGINELENKENAQIINLLTEKLSPKQKAVFVLSEIEEMSNQEIVLITGMNSTAVKSNLYYARKNIVELIKKHL